MISIDLSEVKLVAEIKSIAALQQEGPDSRVGSASSEGAGGQWFQSQSGQLFLYPERKIYLGYSP